MNKNHAQEVQQQTEAAKQEAIKEAYNNKHSEANSNSIIHTINPFTGTATDITPDDLEGIEKLNEANRERD